VITTRSLGEGGCDTLISSPDDVMYSTHQLLSFSPPQHNGDTKRTVGKKRRKKERKSKNTFKPGASANKQQFIEERPTYSSPWKLARLARKLQLSVDSAAEGGGKKSRTILESLIVDSLNTPNENRPELLLSNLIEELLLTVEHILTI